MTGDAEWPWYPFLGFLRGVHRCPARLPKNRLGRWGRCELTAGHPHANDPDHQDHVLEYGMVNVRWSGDAVDPSTIVRLEPIA